MVPGDMLDSEDTKMNNQKASAYPVNVVKVWSRYRRAARTVINCQGELGLRKTSQKLSPDLGFER